MTEQELKALYESTETGNSQVDYKEVAEEKQNFTPANFDANTSENTETKTEPELNTDPEVNNTNTNTDPEVKTEPELNTTEPKTEPIEPQPKTLEEMYKAIEYIEQSKQRVALQEQERQNKLKEEADLKSKQEEERNKPFESSLKDFNYNQDVYSKEEKEKMKAIEEVYGNDLNDYVSLKLKAYESKLTEMVKFIEKNQHEGLTKSISQYHNDTNSKLSSHEEVIRSIKEKEDKQKFEENANKVREKHPDFENQELRNNIGKWIYEEVSDPIDQQNLINLSQSANAKHVIELLDKFKSAKGIVTTPVVAQNTQANNDAERIAKEKAKAEKDKIAKGMAQSNPVRTSQVDTSSKKTLEDLYKSLKI